MSTSNSQLAHAAAILERFTREDPVLERNAARRALSEVARSWAPNEEPPPWSKWFGEASKSLGLRTKSLDCTLDEAMKLVADQAQFVCHRNHNASPSGDQWLAVLGTSGRRCQVVEVGQDERAGSMPVKKLRSALKPYVREGRIRCVVVQSREAIPTSRGQLSPLQRLWRLLKPEASDVWIVVVYSFVVSLLMLATPIAVEALVNTVAFGRFLQPILVLALILLTFLGFQGAVRALQTYVVEIIQRRLFARVAGDLAFRLPRCDPGLLGRDQYLPEMVNRFFDIVTVQKVSAQLLLDGLGLVLGTLIGMVVLGFYHPWLLGFDLFLLGSIAIVIVVLGRGAVASAIKESKHKYHMAAWLEDVARCQTAFHHDGGADFALERADRLIQEYLVARRSHFRIVLRQVLFALGLQALASTVLLGLGGWLVVSGELTLGQLVAAELIVTVIVGSFAKFGKHMESFYDLLASVDKLGVLFDVRMERQDGMLTVDADAPAAVDLQGVAYSWPGQSVIEPIDAEVQPGERVAIVGGAGSGKSTLLDLLFGLRAPSSGHLTIDGFDPRDLRPDVLRRHVALARGQEAFHATVQENVRMHREEVPVTEVRDVLDAIGLLAPILRLPEGYETTLLSNGRPLSDSQTCLLCLARAAVGRPGLLLVDGLLDPLGGEDLELALNFLTAPERPWTLIVATAREDIAERLPRQLEIAPQAALRR